MHKTSPRATLFSFPVVIAALFFVASFGVSANDPPQPQEPVVQEKSDDECYCSVRKRKQVEFRLKKQNSQPEE